MKYYYSIEDVELNVVTMSRFKLLAMLKCILNKSALCVFKFVVDDNENHELLGCIFSKKSIDNII